MEWHELGARRSSGAEQIFLDLHGLSPHRAHSTALEAAAPGGQISKPLREIQVDVFESDVETAHSESRCRLDTAPMSAQMSIAGQMMGGMAVFN